MLTTDFLDRAVAHYADDVGVVATDGTEYTYGEFERRVNRLANALANRGVGHGDRVAILSPNTHWFLEALYAANRLGAVSVPLNYRLVSDDYEYILNDCEATTVLADYEYAGAVEPIRGAIPATEFVAYGADRVSGEWDDYAALLDGASPERPPDPGLAEDDDATINYTSGTTGDPKGVVRTHRTEQYHALSLTHHTEVRDDDVYLWTLPMFHVNGWGYTYIVTGVGGTHVCQRDFDPATTFERIRTHDVSYLCAAPTVLNRLIDYYEAHDVETSGDADVRITTAASPPPEATIRTVEDEFGWRIMHAYGLTETSPLITTSNSPRRIAEVGRFDVKPRQGHATVGAEVRVVDEDGEDVPRDDATIGEIVVRGNQVMDRYLGKPEATETAFTDRIEGYFHTGDLATVDENGMVAIKDRKKDIIISGGENISTAEVEDALYEHPEIAKVAVVGVPSEEWGETPKAVIVPRTEGTLTEDDVVAFARDSLATFKCPTQVEFVDDLPETATGKVQKYELRDRHDDE
jgi:fatty-acyl-CoA synthase